MNRHVNAIAGRRIPNSLNSGFCALRDETHNALNLFFSNQRFDKRILILFCEFIKSSQQVINCSNFYRARRRRRFVELHKQPCFA